MIVYLGVVATGILLRQSDRWWHSRHRPQTAGLTDLMKLQRQQSNNITPALLLLGEWIQIIGLWGIAGTAGPLAWLPASLAIAVLFRHLQEISHFAVHGALTRSAKVGNLLAEAAVHHPLGFVPVSVRRKRHVRDHHPNATLVGSDPNLDELRQAGLLPGATPRRFALALVHPLTPRGIRETATGIAGNLRTSGSWHRLAAIGAVLATAYLIGGWPAVVWGVLIPRLLLYPQLAWMSLVVEHTWFDPDPRSGTPAWVEAGRCLRLYPSNQAMAVLAATTWLPYGDLHHFAHSAHPALRWNYLPALERHLGLPHFAPDGLALGPNSVVRRHRQALDMRSSTTREPAHP
ncbi:fatty acid desaturase [Streptomyces erythrochromogenes]|uniref:fatty acid desaturase n=1 Tax=Streptomyces erythrochromogenes TaxID=285574 RepID=UPI0034269EA0